MRTVKEICDDLETITFRYERLTALIDIIQENEAESMSGDKRLGSALYEILNGLEENNGDANNLLAELRGIAKIQEIKNGKD